MSQYDKDTLYIPLGLKVRNEIFDGFGKEELFQSIIFSIIAGVFDMLIFMLTKNVSICVVTILVAIFGSVMMLTKDKTNLSVFDQLRNMIRFIRMQKKYPYKYYDEWEGRRNDR